MKCLKCGAENENNAVFCYNCGNNLNTQQNTTSKNTPWILTIIITSVGFLTIIFILLFLLLGKNEDPVEATASPIPTASATATAVPSTTPEATAEVQNTIPESNDTTVKYTMYVVNCNEWISLRSKPSTNSTQITTMNLGASCGFIEASVNGFYKVSYNGTTGYALAQYLSIEKPHINTHIAPRNQILHVVNCNESITLRTNDNIYANEITQIPLGASVEFLAQAENGFYKIRYNGRVGYALSQYLR